MEATPRTSEIIGTSQGPKAKSSSQNSFPASALFCRSAPAQTGLRRFLKRTFPSPGAPPVHRCAWLRPLSAVSGFAFREEEDLHSDIEMSKSRSRIQARLRE